jgi:precorrin-6A/cobalt-precorrin-6A reductase
MILVFSGTSEGNEVVKKLLNRNFSIVVSYATDVGENSIRDLKRLYPDLVINKKKLDTGEIVEMIKKYNINYIVDATHPFAVRVSINAIDAAKRENIKYIRFERKGISEVRDKCVIYVDSFKEAKEFLQETKGNIFLTTGVNDLDYFSEIIKDKNRSTYIKILPTKESFNLCLKAGAETKQIIAYYGSWSSCLTVSFIKEKSIDIIVTKQSGILGGELDKINAVKKSNCRLLIIRKPCIKYPDICFDLGNLIKKVNKYA